MLHLESWNELGRHRFQRQCLRRKQADSVQGSAEELRVSLTANVVTVPWDVPAMERTPHNAFHGPMGHISIRDLQDNAVNSRWRVDERQRRHERSVAPGAL